MAQNKETPPGPSPNSPSLLFEYQCRSGKFIRLANRIESKKNRLGNENRIESKLFLPELECSSNDCVVYPVREVVACAVAATRWTAQLHRV